MNWRVELLSSGHVREDFSCGNAALDAYIRKYASQHSRKRIGRTFVAVEPDSSRVLGYYTLSASSVSFIHVPAQLRSKLPRYPLPTALVGKLAVDQSGKGKGLGAHLLMDALRRVLDIADHMAIFAVEVHAADENAKAFYDHFGFRVFEDEPRHLFLPLTTIRQLF